MSESLKSLLPWALFVAAVLHLCEEFLFPGGFPTWYRRYRGSEAASVTTQFLFWINAALIVAAVDVAWTFHSSRGPSSWLVLAGVVAANALWHVQASVRSRTYSPGSFTGVLLYLPTATIGLAVLLRSSALSRTSALLSFAIGASYPAWSAAFHRRGRSAP